MAQFHDAQNGTVGGSAVKRLSPIARLVPHIVALALLALLAIAAGCSDQAPPPAQATPIPPFLMHLPGITGHLWIDDTFIEGITDGGFTGQTEIRDWTNGNRGLGALFSLDDNYQQAQLVADMLTSRYRVDPQSPIFLTAHSGGTAIAVWALEKLPPDVQVRDVILMAPAISPQYDLTAALHHVTGHMHVFYSAGDALILGIGTSLFGNMDRSKGEAAGRVGFVRPPTADAVLYDKVLQHPYQGEWARLGNAGDHIGWMNTTFVAKIIAPLLTVDMQRDPTKEAASGSNAAAQHRGDKN